MIPDDPKRIPAGTRLAAMLLDHFIMTMLIMVCYVPGMIAGFSRALSVSHDQGDVSFMGGPLRYLGLLGFALYFCKDVVNGRSPAKRILKLQVVDNRTGAAATPLQCFVRDLFCVLWMIEGFVAMANTSRRLGDRIAGTKLVYYTPGAEQPRTAIGKLIIPVVIAYGFMLLISTLLPDAPAARALYSENTYNPTASLELEQLITDSLGQYLSPEIRVYDSAQGKNLKYVSGILTLKENYISDDEAYNQLHHTATSLIYSRLPKRAFTGRIKYVYSSTGQFQSRATRIGTYESP